MIKLTAAPEPVWIDIVPGVRVQLRPWSTPVLAAGQAAASAAVAAGHSADVGVVAFTMGVARYAALAWEGVGDEAGEPLDLTPAALQLLLEQSPEAFRAIDRDYVTPSLERSAEKNASAPSPDGTSPA